MFKGQAARSRRIEITSQNHGFAVDMETLPEALELTHKNLYDMTVEGIRHRELPCFSVQYHPEAAPGPHDSHYLFKEFTELMEGSKNGPCRRKRSRIVTIKPELAALWLCGAACLMSSSKHREPGLDADRILHNRSLRLLRPIPDGIAILPLW